MSNDRKSDLSDLKARLGLKQPGGNKPASPSGRSPAIAPKVTQSGAQTTIPRPDRKGDFGLGGSTPSAQPATSSSYGSAGTEPTPSVQARPSEQDLFFNEPAPAAPQPTPQPVKRTGPPPGAMGPPPTARAPMAQPQSGAAPADLGNVDEKLELKDLGITEDVGIGLPKTVYILLVALLGIGLFFGYMASQVSQVRSLESARIRDAQRVLEYLEPKLAAFEEAAVLIEGLDPMEPDFEVAEKLAALDFLVAGDVLPNNRLLLGRDIISPLNRYIVESSLLYEKVMEHNRAVNRTDKAEIEALLEEREELMNVENLALVFDFRHLVLQGRQADYEPIPGRLVSVRDWQPDDEGLVTIQMLSRDTTDEVEIQALVPVDKTDLLRADGDNAMERHERRVNELKHRAEELLRRVEPLRVTVKGVAERGEPPLLTLGGTTEEYADNSVE